MPDQKKKHMKHILADKNGLLVFALASEAAGYFQNRNLLFTGVGKVNATYHLTRQILVERPDMIINLGSAGSSTHKRGEVICCTRFVQRDMDVTPLGFARYETPFCEQDIVLEYGINIPGLPLATCGTGDSFEMLHNTDAYDVVDMEAFSLAWVAKQEGIPFVCLKYISDGADGKAAEDWNVTVHQAAETLHKVFEYC